MGIWEWALAVYSHEGVAQAALRLQDDHGQNVPFLLWAVYAEASDPDRLAKGADLARRWEAAAAKPLRAARRALKPPLEGVPPGVHLRGRMAVGPPVSGFNRLLVKM